ncbi:MAG: peptidase M6 [Gaiellaceae bacterium]
MIAPVLAAIALAVPSTALANDALGDVIHVGDGKVAAPTESPVPVARTKTARAGLAQAAAAESPPIGTKRFWPLINFTTGGADFEEFTLRAVGAKIEIWVSDTLDFPAADCRNDGVRNTITDAQATHFSGEFDLNMHPKMSAVFSSPPSRDGNGGLLEELGIVPPGYYAGPGDKIVTLIANFQDENYGDIEFPSYVAGYHSGDINGFVERNVMSVDSYDWAHRTGANPPNEPSTVLCDNRPAQPFKYEAIFAHEYQHLLEYWASPGELNWIDEGLADYAITVTGYGFPARSIFETGYEGHIQTFLGWRSLQTPANLIPQPKGGAENSLTLWDDQGGLETLSDYGAVWTFMEFLAGRYGTQFMTDLHNEDAKGMPGLQAVLDKYLTGDKAMQVIRDWAAMVALDKAIDDGARLLGWVRESRYQATTLNASIHWANPESYSTPGAPPNGSDYVALRDAAGKPLSSSKVRSIEFSSPDKHAPAPMEWQSISVAGDAVLSAGAADNADRSIIRAVAVPASGDRTLTFDTRYGLETEWDFSFVQVSTDNGLSWTSLANGNTTDVHNPSAAPEIVDQLPGLNGDADWHLETFDLAAYSGSTILLRFRLMTDSGTLGNGGPIEAGWQVDDVKVGGVLVSDGSLSGWTTEAPPIGGYTLQLISIGAKHGKRATLVQVPVKSGRTYSLDAKHLFKALLGKDAETVAMLVMYDEPSESIARYAPYTLKVNGVVQPGG